MSREIILLNITGKDHPGLTAALADVLADNGVNILDIGQAVIHDHLSLGMLLEVPPEAQSVVRENARHAISTLGLDSILYLLGVRDREVSRPH